MGYGISSWIEQTEAVEGTDYVAGTDRSDTAQSAEGTTKKIRWNQAPVSVLQQAAIDALEDSINATISTAVYEVANMAALSALTETTNYILVRGRSTAGDGGGGLFLFSSANLSANVTADTQHAVYIPPDSAPSGASGAWVRQYSGPVDVRWFGVKNDGSDVSTNLLAACNFIQFLGGGRLEIPFTSGIILATGRCKFSSLSNVEIVSYGATIKVPNATADTLQSPAGGHSIFWFDIVSGVTLKGLKLNGNISNRTALAGQESHNCNIRITGCSTVRISDCYSTEAMTDGIYIGDGSTGSASEDVIISGCTLEKCRRNNISGVGQNGLVIENCDISLAGTIQGTLPKDGIDIEPNSSGHSFLVKLKGNAIYDNAGMGISVGGQGTAGIDIEGNTLADNTDISINIETGNSSVRVANNTVVDGGGDHGIRAVGPGEYEILGNKVTGCTAGIAGFSNDGIIIKDNVVIDNASGITLTDFVKAEVTGNTLRDNGTARGFYGIPDDADSIITFSNNIVGTTSSVGDQQQGAELSANCNDLAVGNFFKNIATDNNYLLRFLRAYSNYAPDAGLQGNNNGPMNFSGTPVGNIGQLRINDKLHGAHTAAPASGTWAVGDIVYNTAPAPSGTIGWVCTSAGTPGTWKTFGAIEA